MAVTSINLARVSNNLRAFNLLESLRANQRDMFNVQTSLSTGLRFQRPSDDPIRATSAINLDRRLDRLALVKGNVERANSVLTEIDSSMQSALDLASEAQTLAVQVMGDSISADERRALVDVADSLLQQLVSTGNQRYLNTYLYSGHGTASPFEFRHGGVMYTGDGNRMEAMVDIDLSEEAFTIPGLEFFGAASAGIEGAVDLDPALTEQTRIVDLNGALGRGVTLGRVAVATAAGQAEIDLSGAATVGDVVDKLNSELPTGVVASINARGIVLTRTIPTAGQITLSEVGGGRTAADLGLLGSFNAPARAAVDIDPRLTNVTRLSDLQAGAGVNLTGGLVIRNGGSTATLKFTNADTVEDVLNVINEADVGVWARLADDGRSLELRNRVSGIDLHVEENGGLAATALGLRSMHGGTTLAEINDGLGLQTVTGDDIRITTRDNTTIDVDLSTATTLQDVINLLNTQGAGAITASLATTGNGLVITDNTAGLGTLQIEPLNSSLALEDLGLDVTASGNQLIGGDVNPVRVDSPFTALLELSRGMTTDDRQSMARANERLERVVRAMQQEQGQMAARARMMSERVERVETEVVATQTILSDVQDVDITEAAVRFQQLQTALQANLSTAMQVMNLSVLDYLR